MTTCYCLFFFFFQAEDGIRDVAVTGVQTCALPISFAYLSCLKWPRRCNTAPAISGSATVASSKTSANWPPSSLGTNFPHDTASVYVLPLNPPQLTGSGQMRTP